jgi:hypothetical protein
MQQAGAFNETGCEFSRKGVLDYPNDKESQSGLSVLAKKPNKS